MIQPNKLPIRQYPLLLGCVGTRLLHDSAEPMHLQLYVPGVSVGDKGCDVLVLQSLVARSAIIGCPSFFSLLTKVKTKAKAVDSVCVCTHLYIILTGLISGNIFFRLLDYAADYIQLTYEAFIRVTGVG